MPSLPAGNITYQDARSAILREFGSTVCMIEHKDLFSDIEFKTKKTLSKFADQFYHKAQVLLGASAMVEHNAKLAMKNAVNPYQELYWAMNLFLGQEFTMVQMLDYLCRLEATHNASNKEKPKYTRPVNTNTPANGSTKIRQTQERQIPLTDITCYRCWNKGHYATKCPNGQKVHVVYVPAKEQGKD
ncbi:Cleavage and polyadenylation specificity factor subunit 4 [Entomophthora muscae]|uniref:Cleavage and polyadenylation specificity factor subunit 4 n=1 Tax=Entomophthora muscae TaxID=34485 RepID=A0ACC2SKI1_9FUNG|nr:Cleavage and polyadenylation specificity factor subunit 4 [Entomophthora muscae]